MSKDGHFRIEWKILAGHFTDSAKEDKMLLVYYIYDMRWKRRKNDGARIKRALLKVHLENNSSEILPADQLRFGNEGIRSSAKSLLQRPTTRWPSSQPHVSALTASNSVLLWSINTNKIFEIISVPRVQFYFHRNATVRLYFNLVILALVSGIGRYRNLHSKFPFQT